MMVTNRSTDATSPVRIGAVNYLNTKPLVHQLDRLLPEAKLSFAVPSKLADDLAEGNLDVALVPVIEMAGHPEWQIVSNACIGCRGPVLSVKLLFRVPPHEVRTLALDEGSRTSAVLAQVLLAQIYGVRPQLFGLPVGAEPRQTDADALLIIGDRAIYQGDSEFVETWDLGDRWCRFTELPFVFAVWVARAGIETPPIAAALEAARDRGCEHVEQIVVEQAQAMHLPEPLVREYLTRNLHFFLDRKMYEGLNHFFHAAAQLKLIDSKLQVTCQTT